MIHNDRFFKLEMLILAILNQRDCTSEELTSFLHFQNTLSIKEGVVLTSLFFFLESHLITQYKSCLLYTSRVLISITQET